MKRKSAVNAAESGRLSNRGYPNDERPRRAFRPSGGGQLLGFARLCGLAGPQPVGTDPSRVEAIQMKSLP